jgi:H+/Cl- antiporter ClcA
MPYRLLRRSRHAWLSLEQWKRRLVFWIGAVAVGGVAVVFAIAAGHVHQWLHQGLARSPWLPFVIAPAGLAVVAYLTRTLLPAAKGSGIPQALAALRLRDPDARGALLSLRVAFGKIVLTLIGLLSGASVGREGPTVQVGASIMHALGRISRFPRRELDRGLILAGSAAGVAAAFNTPLAGVVFAIEEMSRSFEQRTSGTVLTAVIIAGIVSIALLGNYTYFGHTAATLSSADDWLAVVVCGVAGGLLGGLFSATLVQSARGLPGRVGVLMRERPVLFAALCGLALAIIGVVSGGTTYGTGYDEARRLVEGGEPLPVAYGLLKLVATIVSYLSGIPGGVFAPSLAVGAGFGANLAHFVPTAPVAAVIILGMVSYFAGVTQSPITAFVIVVEMTDNHEMIVPLMAAALIAHGTSRLVCPKPLYLALANSFMAKQDAARPVAVEKATSGPVP